MIKKIETSGDNWYNISDVVEKVNEIIDHLNSMQKKPSMEKVVSLNQAEFFAQLNKKSIKASLCRGMPHGSCKGETMCDPTNPCFELA